MRVEPPWMGLVPLWKGPQRAPSPLLPCEDTARRRLSMDQEASLQQTWNQQVLWLWTSQLPGLWEINSVYKPHGLWYLDTAAQTNTKIKQQTLFVPRKENFLSPRYKLHFLPLRWLLVFPNSISLYFPLVQKLFHSPPFPLVSLSFHSHPT